MTSENRPLLVSGTVVGHANPELADWEGTLIPNGNGRLWDPDRRRIRVAWHTGSDAQAAGFMLARDLAIKGQCPDCVRPAHYIQAGNGWDRAEGWAHDSQRHALTCWAGKATFEASYPELASD